MKLKNLLKNDDAVSPVIGVILMVAITVILAAVIASFVLGLGDSADEVQPNTGFNFDYQNDSGSGDTLRITLGDGDSLDPSNVYVRGDTGTSSTGDINLQFTDTSGAHDSFIGGLSGSSSEMNAGQGKVIALGPAGEDGRDYDLSIVWETSDDTATLESDTGPEA